MCDYTCKLDTRPSAISHTARSQLIWSAFLQQKSRILLAFSVCSCRKWIGHSMMTWIYMDDGDEMEMKWETTGPSAVGLTIVRVAGVALS